MPFRSEKQRRFLHAKHPEIAARWEQEQKVRIKLNPHTPKKATVMSHEGAKKVARPKAASTKSGLRGRVTGPHRFAADPNNKHYCRHCGAVKGNQRHT